MTRNEQLRNSETSNISNNVEKPSTRRVFPSAAVADYIVRENVWNTWQKYVESHVLGILKERENVEVIAGP